MSLSVRSMQQERMDAPDLDAETYAAVIRDLSKVNRVVMNARPTLAFLKRATKGMRSFRLLDVGFGYGDMLRTIALWARRRGVGADLTGVDLNPNSEAAARAATPDDLPIRYLTGDYAELAGERWDFVISSLVAHHMSREELVAFLRFMERHARRGWFVNDLHRHRFAHFGFPLLAGAMRWHPIVRADGKLSIERAYRPGEWPPILADADVTEARVFRTFPFRLCVERLR